MTLSITTLLVLSAIGGALIGALLVRLWVMFDNHHTDFSLSCDKCNAALLLRKKDGWLYSMHRVALFAGAHTVCKKNFRAKIELIRSAESP